MTSKFRPLMWIPVFLAILACGTFSRINRPHTSPTFRMKSDMWKSIPLPPNPTPPIPSVAFTPTISPPTPSPITISTSAATTTPISLTMQLKIFENIWTIVNDTYIYPDFNGLDWNSIDKEYRNRIYAGLTNPDFYLAMRELIDRLGDDHSLFLSPDEVVEQEAEYQGMYDYVGIGALVSAVPERERAVILSVFSDSPAEATGLQPRDSILSVDGTTILDENGFLRDIVRGPEGTTINISVQTPGEEPREIQVTRHRITGEVPVIYKIITTPDGKHIGYILLITFDDSTVDEQVASALKEMSQETPLDGLILDNRMNGGGSSTVIEPLLGYFVGGNLGNFINRNDERPLEVRLEDINGSSEVPLVVLISYETASFGEIFAGILQDTGRAYLIGNTTQGNVEILWGYVLEDGSKLWLANETFRPLNHPEQNWEKMGIVPDLIQSGDFDEYSLANDPVVLAAIGYLSEH